MFELLPSCTNACPVQTDVRGYLAAVARREYIEAYRLIRANNPFPSACAWICPAPCEDACRRAGVDAPLAIREIKRFVVEASGAACRVAVHSSGTGKKIAIVGAGPAGLTAAYDLARLGHRAVVYERQHSPGGQLLASVPLYRLPREVLKRDVEGILSAGVEVRCGVEVGRDVTVSRLKKEYNAVIISTGLWAGRRLSLPGFDRPGVYTALPFLKMANLGEKLDIGRRVAVIGGGDVAMDAARTALRLGASEVRVVCLEQRDRMPAHRREVEEALAEGVAVLPGFGPVEVLSEGGKVAALVVQKVKSLFDQEGRFSPVYEPGSFLQVPCDAVILAIGQAPDNVFLAGSGLKTGPGGRLEVERQYLASGENGVFVCGELADGPGMAIAAVASGHRVAALVERFLNGEMVGRFLSGEKPDLSAEKIMVIGPVPPETAKKIPRCERRNVQALPPGERVKNFLPYETGLDEKAAFYEASRCMSCGLGARVDATKCVACLTCLRVCPYGVPVVRDRASMPAEGCQACGTCAACCPAGAITVELLDEEALAGLLSERFLKDNIVAFTCGALWIEGLNKENKGEGRSGAPRRVRFVRLPAVDALRLEWVLKAFECGAAGVAVVACGDSRCRLCGGGAGVIKGVFSRARDLLKSIGIPPERLYYCQPAGGDDPVEMLGGFAARAICSERA